MNFHHVLSERLSASAEARPVASRLEREDDQGDQVSPESSPRRRKKAQVMEVHDTASLSVQSGLRGYVQPDAETHDCTRQHRCETGGVIPVDERQTRVITR